MYPHQPRTQATYLIEQSRERYGDYWSAVIVTSEGGFAMSLIEGETKNTR